MTPRRTQLLASVAVVFIMLVGWAGASCEDNGDGVGDVQEAFEDLGGAIEEGAEDVQEGVEDIFEDIEEAFESETPTPSPTPTLGQ